MAIRVFKFGGASVKNSENIRNVASIIESYGSDKILIVISAMGKTTNALEHAVKYIQNGEVDSAQASLNNVIEDHLRTATELGLNSNVLNERYNDFVEKALKDCKSLNGHQKDLIYDQIVSLGELFSTIMVSSFLDKIGFNVEWQDIREVMTTDDRHRMARVDFEATQNCVDTHIKPRFEKTDIVITQGFIGRAPSGLTTTLGREGSDYTAAILAYCMNTDELSIWKDVPGVLTADPRRFENVEKIDRMSYKEAIEMTYYGAQVIHPKTIRPLQNKGIKLYVKSFLNPQGEGTLIAMDGLLNYPPLVVFQEDVILLQISSKDFSFIAENHLSQIFNTLNENRISMCTMRNSAISFTICIKNPGEDRLNALMGDLSEHFSIDIFKDLQLITIRYFNKQLVEKLTRNKVVLFEERMKYTIQMVVKPSLELIEKAN